jgi:two-component system response regulator YesN
MPSSSFGPGTNSSQPLSARKHIKERVAAQSDPPTDELQEERVSKILEAIKSGRLCSLHGLAGELNLSKSHLQHLFKRQTGLRLGHLIVEQKLQRAAHLLENSNLRIKEIAGAVGYEHASSFIRAFEHRFAEAPQAYRHRCNRSKC